jgi:colanic acid/amylovoran biosynthesis glycosyltransferase
MNIGYILGEFPKLSETFVLNEIVELVRMGHEVHIFSIFHPKESIVQSEVKEYDLLKRTYYAPSYFKLGLELLKPDSLLFYRNERLFNKFYCIAAARYFSKIIRKLNLDIIHAHFANEPAFTAMLISKLTSVPFTFTAHAFDIFINPAVKALNERMKNASVAITPSYYNKKYLHNLTGIDKDKIRVVRACPNMERFKSIKRDEDAFTILTIGRLVEKKGIKYGILAVKELIKDYSEIQYKIVGSGPLESELRGLAKSLNLGNNVKFLGSLDSNSLMDELSKATIFILPCVRSENGDMDGIPVSLMDSMYLQIPTISTNISGIQELIENGKEGLLAEPKNVEQLANVIKTLLEDKDLRVKMEWNGRKKIEKDFNIHTEVEKLLKVWEEIKR